MFLRQEQVLHAFYGVGSKVSLANMKIILEQVKSQEELPLTMCQLPLHSDQALQVF